MLLLSYHSRWGQVRSCHARGFLAGIQKKRNQRTMYEQKTYAVYILASKRNGTLYTGVTNDLSRRVYEHKEKNIYGFTKRYNVSILVYYEMHEDINEAIRREKQIKKWNRKWKLQLIEKYNPKWIDLYDNGNIIYLPLE
jgi:putative endonuclease